MDIGELRKLFPVTQDRVYLNHASVSPPSLRVQEAVGKIVADIGRRGVPGYFDWTEFAETEAKSRFARFIGAEREEIAFLKNTTEGIAIVATGLDWSPGDNVVSAAIEFPSNALQWVNLKDLGVETRFVPARDGRVPIEDIERQMDDRTRVVALSFVEFLNGFRNNLEAIGRLCRERGILFCVDAIQGLGVFDVDVAGQCVDFLSCGGHKWLLGFQGIAGFYCRGDLMDRLRIREVGWRSVEGQDDPLGYDLTPLPTAKRFEGGSENLIGIVGLDAAIGLLQEVGVDFVRDRVKALTDRIVEGLEERGYTIMSPRGPDEWSGIVSLQHPEIPFRDLGERLKNAGIELKVRIDHVRVSPHFYNTSEEVDTFLSALP